MQRKMLYMRKTPLSSAAILYLLAAGLVFFPTQWLGDLFTADKQLAGFLGLGILRLVMAGVMFVLAFHMGVGGTLLPRRGDIAALLFALPALAVAVNNLPIVALAQGSVSLTAPAGKTAAFALQCIGVGLFEEEAFRGVIFPFVLGHTGTGRKGRFQAVILSSAAFGLLHLVNLFGGFSGGVFLQVGYSFLIGAMLAICMFRGAGVLPCAIIHALFNFCGNLFFEGGNATFSTVWTWQEILLTAAVGVAAAAYFIWLLAASPADRADAFAVRPSPEPPADGPSASTPVNGADGPSDAAPDNGAGVAGKEDGPFESGRRAEGPSASAPVNGAGGPSDAAPVIGSDTPSDSAPADGPAGGSDAEKGC